MKILIGIQARSNSTRFPNKIYEKIGDDSILKHIYKVCNSVKVLEKVVSLQTWILSPHGDGVLESYCKFEGLPIIPGPEGLAEDDLVARYNYAIGKTQADAMIRITSDCPLLDPNWIKAAIKSLLECDYVSNTISRTVVDGFDVQGISKNAWAYYEKEAKDREHVFRDIEQDYIFRDNFMKAGFTIQSMFANEPMIPNPFHPKNKLSVDTMEDFERVKGIYEQIQRKS